MSISKFLRKFSRECCEHPERLAYFTSRRGAGNSLTYGELQHKSDALAAFLRQEAPHDKPVMVYGHKSPFMLVAFFAAVKAGLGYAPVDIAYPADRVNDILEQLEHPFVLSLADGEFPGDVSLTGRIVDIDGIAEACESGETVPEESWVSGDDIFYLLFTSGSTGRPKGVQMPSGCVDAFMEYFTKLFPEGGDRISFNRVPYTFDVSLFDIIGGLASGYTLFALESECEQSMAASFEALAQSGLTTWVSTPSYIEMCLADPSFNSELLPRLDTVILCGEVFRNSTALKLLERFPKVRIFNTYGPTETQAVTDIEVTQNLAETVNPLPVGALNPAMRAIIRDIDTGEALPQGSVGEICLEGATVSLGYFGRPDLTEKAFSVGQDEKSGKVRSYRTGDKGYVDEAGLLYCLGRLDFQVNLNGFRVELGDVEQGLVSLSMVKEAVVLPAEKDGKVTHLVAHVQLADPDEEKSFKMGQAIKTALRHSLPEYMIPKKITFHDEFALNVNGKIDRKALA